MIEATKKYTDKEMCGLVGMLMASQITLVLTGSETPQEQQKTLGDLKKALYDTRYETCLPDGFIGDMIGLVGTAQKYPSVSSDFAITTRMLDELDKAFAGDKAPGRITEHNRGV